MISPWCALREAVHYVRERGVRPFLSKAVRSYVVGTQQWYVTRTGLDEWAGLPRRDPTLEVRLARPEDVPPLAKHGRQLPQTLARWLAPPYIFFVATRDGVPIAFRCASTTPHPWVAGFFRDRLAPDQAYGMDLFVAPEVRHQGITFDLMAVSSRWMAERGYRDLLSIQRLDNEASIALTATRPIERLGTLTRTCRLGRVRFSFAPVEAAAPGTGDVRERVRSRAS